MIMISRAVSDAAFAAVRKMVGDAGYGGFVSDENARALGDAVATAAVRAAINEAGGHAIDPKQPLAPRD